MVKTRRTRKLTLRRRGKIRSRVLLPARRGHVQKQTLARDAPVSRRQSKTLLRRFLPRRIPQDKVIQSRYLQSKALQRKTPNIRRRLNRDQFRA